MTAAEDGSSKMVASSASSPVSNLRSLSRSSFSMKQLEESHLLSISRPPADRQQRLSFGVKLFLNTTVDALAKAMLDWR